MAASITELTGTGLVDRRSASRDRRSFALTLTEAGSMKMREGDRRIAGHEAAMLADLAPAERDLLLDCLDRISAREES